MFVSMHVCAFGSVNVHVCLCVLLQKVTLTVCACVRACVCKQANQAPSEGAQGPTGAQQRSAGLQAGSDRSYCWSQELHA